MTDRRRTPRPRPAKGSAVPPGPQVVAIGASAGGLEAFRGFFKAMPETTGLAFVLIQHLDPEHKSHMAELLSKYTSMKVREATHRAVIERDCVYVIPPNRTISIRKGRLLLSLPDQARGRRTPIDHFFLSLAEDRGEKAVCIIMSSTGSDGLLGLRTVKAAGGMSMVQEPATAQYGDLPAAAIATGLVDYILPVEQMPKTLLSYLSHAYICGPEPLLKKGDPDGLSRVLDLLRTRTTHDFRYYKRGTLLRRIERRMGLNQIHALPAYVDFLQKTPVEVIQLSKDLMIGVTSFFRDPDAFEELRKRVIPSLVRSREPGTPLPENPIRVWVPGCATGEEAYSLAMLILEELEVSGLGHKVQVFATDIDDTALQFGRISHYPQSIAQDITPGRLKRFFSATDHGYLVNKVLRESVVFASQNLISSPPFSKIDLISCRNLAIYLESELQKKLIELFHFALAPGGYLFLGSSEGIGSREDLFRPISKKWRIYQRLGGGRRELTAFPVVTPGRAPPPSEPGRSGPQTDLTELSRRLLSEHHDSAGVLVDRKGKILHLFGATGKYLELSAGEPSLDLSSVVREGLRARLRTAVNAVIRDEVPVVLERESVKRDGFFQPVRVTVAPVKSPASAEGLIHLVFEDVAVPESIPPRTGGSAGDERDAALARLEAELKTTREDLQDSVERLETSNEELKVSNEEVMSSNEELQSTNEELETSKEELQSLNEELSTLNSQLQEKVQELSEATNDLANLLSSAEIATVFLDTKFRIKRFTQPIAKLLNLIPTDVGRPIRHMAQNLGGVDILDDAQTVLRKLIPIQRQVRSDGGETYMMRVLPYRTSGNVIEGIVVTFTDVSEMAAREAHVVDRERRQRLLAELGLKALVHHSTDKLAAFAARMVQEALGADLSDVLTPDADGRALFFKAGAGWKDPRPRESGVPLKGATGPAVAFRTRSTVVMNGAASGRRVQSTPPQRAERVASAMYSVIVGRNGPSGVLGAHSRKKRAFGPEDAQFLQDVAALLGNAFERARVETELRVSGERLEARVRERTLWLAAAKEVSRAADRAETPVGVMNQALKAFCSGSEWQFGHVYLVSPQNPQLPLLESAWYPPESERFRAFESLSRKVRMGPQTMPGKVVKTGSPIWSMTRPPSESPDPSQGAWAFPGRIPRLDPPRERLARRLGILTGAAVPLKDGIQIVGVLEVFSDKLRRPSRVMLDMMEQVCIEVGRAVERAHTQERFSALLIREQRSLAQELHDTVGQELTGLGAMSESLMRTLAREGRIDPIRLKRLTLGLRTSLEKLRAVTSGLSPQEIDAKGLAPALARLMRHTGFRSGLTCRFRRSGRGIRLDGPAAATHLYRIAQEAVSNAVRHARARRITVELRRSARDIILTIRDDGRGVPKQRYGHEGVGLRIMQQRASATGGRITFQSAREKGTVVTCTVPASPPRPYVSSKPGG